MKKKEIASTAAFLIMGLISCVPVGASDMTNPNTTTTGFVKTLIWADEFNVDGAPDATKWDYELGYIRNNEVQGYSDRPKNVRVERGRLMLQAHLEDWAYEDRAFEYTSGSINTKGKVNFEGDFRMEIFAKVPSGKGLFPAIWMMGKEFRWPQCSELDIMEYVGSVPNTIHGTMHWATADNIKQKTGKKLVVDDLHSKFHLYGLERVGSNIKLFINDNYFLSFDVPADAYQKSFTQPLYLLLNFALGGGWAGEVDDVILPQTLEVDYVRAYSLKKK